MHVLEIRDLTDLESMYHAPGCQCSEACRALTLKEKTMDRDEGLKVLSPAQAGRELHALTVQEMKRHRDLSYSEAQARTARVNPELVRWYARITTEEPSTKAYAEAGAEVQKRISAERVKNPGLGMADAMRKVLDADAFLKARYLGRPILKP